MSLDRADVEAHTIGSDRLLGRKISQAILAVALAVSAVVVTGCQTTCKAQPEMLTGDAEVAHERHATGIDSHTAD